MSINPSNFIAFGTTDLGNIITNQVTATITFPSNTTTINKQSVAFSKPIIITESQIMAQMDGSPLNGDQVYTFGPAVQSRFVAIGSGANGAVYSNDGVTINPISAITSNTSSALYWSGNKWVGAINLIAHYSYNGINWQSTGQAVFANGIAWKAYYNGSIYLMVTLSGTNHIAYSYDGINWTSSVGYTTTSIYTIAWNGVVWLAGGNGTNFIAYSYDGINWTPSTNGNSIFTQYCLGLVWIGDKWVGVGQASSLPLIAYTTDPTGATGWTAISGISTLIGGSQIESVCWNGKILCATCVGSVNLQAYSYDGINWFTNSISKVFSSSGYTAASIVWNGRSFFAASPGNTGNALAHSYDGINWTGLGNTHITSPYSLEINNERPHSITFQRNLTIVGGTNVGTTGNIMAYSLDGLTWNPCNAFFGTTGANTCVYNGRIWVAGCDNTTGNCIAVSKDGINWTGLGSFGLTTVESVVWSGYLWVAGGTSASFSLLYSYDGYTWITSPTNRNNITFVLYSNDIYLALQGRSVFKSTDGINWSATAIYTSSRTVVYAQVVNNIFVLSTNVDNSQNIIYSYDAVNWQNASAKQSDLSIENGRYMLWDGVKYIFATASSVFASYDLINWRYLTGTQFKRYTYNGTIYNGVRDISANSSGSSGYSYNGINWTNLTMFGSIFTGVLISMSNNYNVEPIPFIQHPTLALGSGTVNTIAYSPDGITWSGLGKTVFSTRANTAFWSGSIWIAGGQGLNTMAYSYDGIQWTPISNPFSTTVTGIAYNGNTWVATGTGGNTVAYSSSGLTWTGTAPSGFIGGGSVSWNGTVFIITPGASSSAYYSTIGTSWSQSGLTNAIGLPATNGYTWVCPIVGSPGLAYINQSNPGTTAWTQISSLIFTVQGLCVCYGGTVWVAGGLGGNSLALSYNGINWTGLGTVGTTVFPNGCTSICWNGTRFVGTGGNYIGYSSNGNVWYSAPSLLTNGNCVVSNPGIGGFVAPSAMVLNNNGISGNGIACSQTLEIVSSDPYYQSGFDSVSIVLNTKYQTT